MVSRTVAALTLKVAAAPVPALPALSIQAVPTFTAIVPGARLARPPPANWNRNWLPLTRVTPFDVTVVPPWVSVTRLAGTPPFRMLLPSTGRNVTTTFSDWSSCTPIVPPLAGRFTSDRGTATSTPTVAPVPAFPALSVQPGARVIVSEPAEALPVTAYLYVFPETSVGVPATVRPGVANGNLAVERADVEGLTRNRDEGDDDPARCQFGRADGSGRRDDLGVRRVEGDAGRRADAGIARAIGPAARRR